MLNVLLALLAGGLGGGLVAGLVGRPPRRQALPDAPLDPELEHQINGAAVQWAEMHGQPAAARLIADKLRLAYALSQRPRRRRGRWSR